MSPHLVAAGQEALFAMTRHWTPAAFQRDLIELTRNQQWEEVPRSEAIRTMKILLAWIGAEVPIQEEDIHQLAQLRAGLSAKPVVQFLEPPGMLIPDAERRKDTDLQIIEGYPETIADELRAG